MKKERLTKRILSVLLTVATVVAALPLQTMEVRAAENKIELKEATWDSKHSSFQFVNPQVSVDEQSIICVSVDNGSFTPAIPGGAIKKSGVNNAGAYVDGDSIITGETKMQSITVMKESGTFTTDDISNFIKNTTFYKDDAEKVKVSVITSDYELKPNEGAMIVDDGIHYYRLVKWTDDLGNENAKSWYQAYNDAKSSHVGNLKGYLATITSANEQEYLQALFGHTELENEKKYKEGFWLGGARTYFEGEDFVGTTENSGSNFKPDLDQLGDDVKLVPCKLDNTLEDKRVDYQTKWRWVCGPEATEGEDAALFYTTSDQGKRSITNEKNFEENGKYSNWRNGDGYEPNDEPNNSPLNDDCLGNLSDEYGSEYALVYGYGSYGYWNDFTPNRKDIYGYIVEYSAYGENTYTEQDPGDTSTITETETTVPTVTITAHDFLIARKDAKNENGEELSNKVAELARVSTDPDGNEVRVSPESLTKIRTTADNLDENEIEDVVLTATGADDVQVKGIIRDVIEPGENSKISIGANDFEITREELKDAASTDAKLDSQLKEWAKVFGINDDTTYDYDNPKLEVKNREELEAKAGKYPVTFALKDAFGDQIAEVTVYATVKAGTVNGKDFPISPDGKGLMTPEEFIGKASVTTKDKDDKAVDPKVNAKVNQDDLDKLNELLKNGVDGEKKVDVRVKGPDDSETTITVTVTPEGTDDKTPDDKTPDDKTPGENPAAKVEISDPVDGDPKDKKIEGTKGDEGEVVYEITVPSSQEKVEIKTTPEDDGKLKDDIDAGNLKGGANVVGDNPGDFTVENLKIGDNGSVSVTVESKDGKNTTTLIYKITREPYVIDAHDVIVKVGDPVTPEEVVGKSDAKVVDDKGKEIKDKPITPKDPEQKVDTTEATDDPIEVTLKGDDDVNEETVKVYVVDNIGKDDNVEDPADPEKTHFASIGANGFDIPMSLAQDPDAYPDKLKELANVVGLYDGKPVAPEDIELVSHTIKPEVGKTYTATFKIKDTDAKVTVDVKVVDDSKIDAKDVELEAGSKDKIDEKGLLDLAEAKGEKDGNPVDVKVYDQKDLDELNDLLKNKKPGTVDVTLTTPDGTTKTIKVTVKDQTPAGGDIVFETTNPKDLVLKIDPNKELKEVKINDKVVTPDPSNYVDDKKGNLTIKASYLQDLYKQDPTRENYVVEVVYKDNTNTKVNFMIKEFDETKVVKNPPMFKMMKYIVLKNKFTINLNGISENAKVTFKSSNKKVATVNQKGVVKGKKKGKAVITATIVQNGAYYNVKVNVQVIKKGYKGYGKNYNLNNKAIVKKSGELPEFNVYKNVGKGKSTTLQFTDVTAKKKDISFSIPKKEKKYLKIGKVKYNAKKKTASVKITGKKKGWVHLTAKITQNGKVYYTRLLIRVDDNTWTAKQKKKYLK